MRVYETTIVTIISVSITLAVNRIFPSIQRVVIIPEGGSTATTDAVDSTQNYVYKVFYDGHSPGNDGFLGINHAKPVWWFNIWILNGGEEDIRHIFLSAASTGDVIPIQMKGNNLREIPDAGVTPTVVNTHNSRKMTVYIDSLPAQQAGLYVLGVQGETMPEISDLNISVNCDGITFLPVTDKVWQKIPWKGDVPH